MLETDKGFRWCQGKCLVNKCIKMIVIKILGYLCSWVVCTKILETPVHYNMAMGKKHNIQYTKCNMMK